MKLVWAADALNFIHPHYPFFSWHDCLRFYFICFNINSYWCRDVWSQPITFLVNSICFSFHDILRMTLFWWHMQYSHLRRYDGFIGYLLSIDCFFFQDSQVTVWQYYKELENILSCMKCNWKFCHNFIGTNSMPPTYMHFYMDVLT